MGEFFVYDGSGSGVKDFFPDFKDSIEKCDWSVVVYVVGVVFFE